MVTGEKMLGSLALTRARAWAPIWQPIHPCTLQDVKNSVLLVREGVLRPFTLARASFLDSYNFQDLKIYTRLVTDEGLVERFTQHGTLILTGIRLLLGLGPSSYLASVLSIPGHLGMSRFDPDERILGPSALACTLHFDSIT